MEVGLDQSLLCQYTADLRCIGVLFLIRFIIKKYCDCEDSPCCCHRQMPLWTNELKILTGAPPSRNVLKVAILYGREVVRHSKFGHNLEISVRLFNVALSLYFRRYFTN